MVGDKIWYIHRQQGKIIRYKGIVTEKISNFRYRVDVEGYVRICHINQLEKRVIRQQPIFHELERDSHDTNKQQLNSQNNSLLDKTVTDKNTTDTPKITTLRRNRNQSTDVEEIKERPARERNKPNWYNPSSWLR
jgi:hypothetical protein